MIFFLIENSQEWVVIIIIIIKLLLLSLLEFRLFYVYFNLFNCKYFFLLIDIILITTRERFCKANKHRYLYFLLVNFFFFFFYIVPTFRFLKMYQLKRGLFTNKIALYNNFFLQFTIILFFLIYSFFERIDKKVLFET